MSYKSLLFCPDEKTARVVTQVLTELEFAVEPANEPFGAVKKLTEERFDALVVDCQNEQDASLLFKTARDSTQNHSSLSVAVVEGQTGVAKAFRIGANLVLTKPINIEQSKGTLRVARGLVRKNEAKPVSPPWSPKGGPVAPTAAPQAALPQTSLPTSFSSLSGQAPPKNLEAPFSALEVETDPVPATEAAEVALLESLPDLNGKPAPAPAISGFRAEAEPIATGTSGQAAAAAPALEKAPQLGFSSAASAAPMVTNEPIIADKHYDEPFDRPQIDVPSFSSLEASTRQSGSGARFFKLAVVLGVLAVAGYFGWQKLQPLKYFQKIHAAHSASATESPEAAPSPQESSTVAPLSTSTSPLAASSAASASTSASQSLGPEHPTPLSSENEISAAQEVVPKDDKSETIEVKEMPMPGDPKPSPGKPQPLMVKRDKGNRFVKPAAVAPPLQVSSLDSSGLALPRLATVDVAVPKLATGSVRVSQGVSQGLLLKKVPPAYPPMALQLHKEGVVELLATINKQGQISNVKPLSGDVMLSKAAADAVRQWRYRPYLLNGEPVEIQTQITITFKTPR